MRGGSILLYLVLLMEAEQHITNNESRTSLIRGVHESNYSKPQKYTYDHYFYKIKFRNGESKIVQLRNLKLLNKSTNEAKFWARYSWYYYKYLPKGAAVVVPEVPLTNLNSTPQSTNNSTKSGFASSTIKTTMASPVEATTPAMNIVSKVALQESNNMNNFGMGMELKPQTTEETYQTKAFNESNFCYHIPSYSRNCPSGFTYFPNRLEDDDICYVLLEDEEFPFRCPYSNYLPYDSIEYLLNTYFYFKTIWLHAFRSIRSGYGYFRWRENGHYGEPIKNFSKEFAALNLQDTCLIIYKGNFIPVPCTDRHAILCAYSKKKIQSSSLVEQCNAKYGGRCTLDHYSMQHAKCLCLRENRAYPPKNEFCEKSAELILPFQTEFLLDKPFANTNSTCWIGFRKEPTTSGMYKWSTSNQYVAYTRWSKYATCENTEGAIKFNEPTGWILTPDRTLNCSICEYSLDFSNPLLRLQYSLSEKTLELVVINASSIIFYDTKSEIHCFSDDGSSDFFRKIRLQKKLNAGQTMIMVFPQISDHPSHYWCEAFRYPWNSFVASNKIVAYNKVNGYGHEFAFMVDIPISEKVDPFLQNKHVEITEFIKQHIQNCSNFSIFQFLRPMRGYIEEKTSKMKLLLHLTTLKTNLSPKEQHAQLKEILDSICTENLTITNLLSSEVCFFDTTMSIDGKVLEWPETKVGITVIPSNVICLDVENDMKPVTRTCTGNFLNGTKWLAPVGNCYTDIQLSEVTEELYQLSNDQGSTGEINQKLIDVTGKTRDPLAIDIYLTSTVLENLARRTEDVVVSPIINNILSFNSETLKRSQFLLNSTDRILEFLDEIVKRKEYGTVQTKNFIIQISDLQTSNVTGLSVHRMNFFQYNVNPLYANTSLENIQNDPTLDSVVFLSPNVITEIKQELAHQESIKLIIMVFFNDVLFNEVEDFNQQTLTKIISVTVPEFNRTLRSPIKIGFKMKQAYSNIKNCSHWKYGVNDVTVSIHGNWVTNTLSRNVRDLLEICDFIHMTHFALLLQGELMAKFTPPNYKIFEILSIIGSSLSLFGIIPIYLTAIFFKQWRTRSGNIILLNFCTIITLQIIIIGVLNLIREDGISCTLLGAGLHYTLLSEFLWMFIIARLQYRRFVLVLQPQLDHIVKKCLIVGWGVPLIPVIITMSISPSNYSIDMQGFCMISGDYSTYGMFLPIITILVCNALYFVKIIYSVIRQNMITAAANGNRNIKLELLLAVFLFFTLGLNWVLSIIGAIWGWTIFTYIFFVTATLRGLVLFLYFIVGNKETRLMWKKRSHYHFNKGVYKTGSMQSSNKLIWYND